MRECWLKPNRRPLLACGVFSALIAAAAAGSIYPLCLRGIWFGLSLAGVCAGLASASAVLCLLGAARPRLAYEDGELLVFAGSSMPHRVPIDVVEVLFLGSGPALPCDEEKREQTGPRTANVVVRLAESAADWHNRQLPQGIGKWSAGYIVLSGTWCEPISHERLNAINRRLAELRRERRDSQATSPQVTS